VHAEGVFGGMLVIGFAMAGEGETVALVEGAGGGI
jgi:hypothetical protein